MSYVRYSIQAALLITSQKDIEHLYRVDKAFNLWYVSKLEYNLRNNFFYVFLSIIRREIWNCLKRHK